MRPAKAFTTAPALSSPSMERITAARGTSLRCKGWRQEAILRMLENNLENAEKPEELIIYGGRGKAARNWDAFHKIVKALKALSADETLLVQSGKPVAVLRPYRKDERPRRPGALRGRIQIAPDFDELPDDLAEALGAKPR